MVLHFCPGVLSSLLAPRWQLVSDWSPHPRYSHLLLISSDCSSQYLGPWWRTVPRWIVILTSVSVANFFVSCFSPNSCLHLPVQIYLGPCLFPLDLTWMSVSESESLHGIGLSVFVSLWYKEECEPVIPYPGPLFWNPWSPHPLITVYIYIHNSRGVVNKCPFDCIALNPA